MHDTIVSKLDGKEHDIIVNDRYELNMLLDNNEVVEYENLCLVDEQATGGNITKRLTGNVASEASINLPVGEQDPVNTIEQIPVPKNRSKIQDPGNTTEQIPVPKKQREKQTRKAIKKKTGEIVSITPAATINPSDNALEKTDAKPLDYVMASKPEDMETRIFRRLDEIDDKLSKVLSFLEKRPASYKVDYPLH